MGHSQLETSRAHLDEIGRDDLADVLEAAAAHRHAQASSDRETDSDRPGRASKLESEGGRFV